MTFSRLESQRREGMALEQRLATALVLLGALVWAVSMVLMSSADKALQFLAVRVRGRALTDDGLVAATEFMANAANTMSIILLLGALTVWSAGRSKVARTARESARDILRFLPQRSTHLVFAVIVVLTPGYRFMGNPGNDMGTYFAIVLSAIDPSFAIGDLESRAGEGWGLPGYVLLFRVLSPALGFDRAAFVLTLLAVLAVSSGLSALGQAVGLGVRQALLASALGLGLTWGVVGYPVSVISDELAYATPRILAISLVVWALAFIAQRRFILASVVGVLASSIHALDGFVPTFLALLAGIIAQRLVLRTSRTSRDSGGRGLLRHGGSGLILLSVVGTLASEASGNGVFANDVAIFLAAVGLVTLVLARIDWSQMSGSTSRRELVGLASLAVVGIAFIAGRGLGAAETSGLGVLERVRLFESVLTQLRNPWMTSAVAQSPWRVFLLVLVAVLAVTPLLSRPEPFTQRFSSPDSHSTSRAGLAFFSLLGFLMVATGMLLQTRLSMLGVATVFPTRYTWLVVPGAIMAVVRRVPNRYVPGTLPLSLSLLLAFQYPWFRGATSLLFIAVGLAAFVAVDLRQSLIPSRAIRACARPISAVREQATRSPAQGVHSVAALALAGLILAPALQDVPLPLVSHEASRAAMAAKRPEIQIARIAEQNLNAEARVLLPPTGNWGSFKVMSSRGAAFDWKHFSSDTASWYEEFRRICDPSYTFAVQENYGQPSQSEISECYRTHAPDSLAAVAAVFLATHAVVQVDQWPEAEIVGVSDDGQFALVAVPPQRDAPK